MAEESDSEYMYMHMGKIAAEKDSVLMMHAHDGEPIAECIQKKLINDPYRIKFEICDLTRTTEKAKPYQVVIFLLTQESMDFFNSLDSAKCKSLQTGTLKSAILQHDSLEMNEQQIKTSLQNKLPNSENCDIFKMTGIRPTLVHIIGLLEEEKDQIPCVLQYRLEPNHVLMDYRDVFILFKNPKERTTDVTIQMCNKKVKAKYLNPYTFSFSPYGFGYGKLRIDVYADGVNEGTTFLSICGKMDLLQHEINDIASPMEFLCQVLRITEDRQTLDMELADRLNSGGTNNPLAGLEDLNRHSASQVRRTDTEIPTILHFGAKFGLSALCEVLKKFPGFEIAAEMENKDGRTPSQIAEKSGYHDLSEELSNYPYKVIKKRTNDDIETPEQDKPLLPERPREAQLISQSLNEYRSQSFDEFRRRPGGDLIRQQRVDSGLSIDSGTSGLSDGFEFFDYYSSSDSAGLPISRLTRVMEDMTIDQEEFPKLHGAKLSHSSKN